MKKYHLLFKRFYWFIIKSHKILLGCVKITQKWLEGFTVFAKKNGCVCCVGSICCMGPITIKDNWLHLLHWDNLLCGWPFCTNGWYPTTIQVNWLCSAVCDQSAIYQSPPTCMSVGCIYCMQWRIQDFPKGGTPTPKVGTRTYFFGRKLHENERILARGGARP